MSTPNKNDPVTLITNVPTAKPHTRSLGDDAVDEIAGRRADGSRERDAENEHQEVPRSVRLPGRSRASTIPTYVTASPAATLTIR